MVKVIDFVQKPGPDYGYRLNMDKSIYLISPPANHSLSEVQLEDRVKRLEKLGVPRANIKIHPNRQDSCSSCLSAAREEQFGFKVLGAYVGLTKYVMASLNTKFPQLQRIMDALLKPPNAQGRRVLCRLSFNPRINYLLRAHLLEHSRLFVNDFKRRQMKLITSRHEVASEDELHLRRAQTSDLHVANKERRRVAETHGVYDSYAY